MNYSDEEKIKRLLDAQEHPEHYTDEELREIIREARPLANLKRALMEERAEDQNVDVEGAWKAFSRSHPDESPAIGTESSKTESDDSLSIDSHTEAPLLSRRIPRWLRVAAVFIGCVFLAGVAFAAMTQLGLIRSPFAAEKPEVVQRAPVAAASRDTNSTTDSIAPKKPAPVVKVFYNATLTDILSEMGRYYGLKIVFHNESARTIRLHFGWNQAKSIDTNIAILNGFQQIVITRSGDTLNVE